MSVSDLSSDRTVRRLIAVVTLPFVLGIACRNDDPQASRPTASSVQAAPPTTAAAGGPTVLPSPVTPNTAPSCTAVPIEPRVDSVTNGRGDFDGDGVADQLRAYRDSTHWHLRVMMAGGGEIEIQTSGRGGPRVRALGGAKVDDDPSDEALATIDTQESAEVLSIYAVRDCRLGAVTLDGRQARLLIGGTQRRQFGVECTDLANDGRREVLVHEATNTTGNEYDVRTTVYRLSGNALQEESAMTSRVTSADPGFARFGSLTCGAVIVRGAGR